jgi:hypothetical protein
VDLLEISWLGIKNDYRTLIEVDNLDFVKKVSDEDEEAIPKSN